MESTITRRARRSGIDTRISVAETPHDDEMQMTGSAILPRLALCLAAMLQVGCQPRVLLELLNSSRSAVSVRSGGESCLAVPGTLCTVPYSDVMTVYRGEIQSRYVLPAFSISTPGYRAYSEMRGIWGPLVLSVRLAENSSIAATTPHDPRRSINPRQPHGYPIVPLVE